MPRGNEYIHPFNYIHKTKQMKKILAPMLILLLIISTITLAFNEAQQPPKVVVVQGTVQDWNQVLNVIDQSAAPHNDVKAVEQWILNQINAQIKSDSTKVDSTKKKK